MIVCHCQNITDHDIDAAINLMRAADNAALITPGKVYRALGKSADCRRLHAAISGNDAREESIEEMHHADKLIARILFLGGHPNLQKLDALRIGQTPKETLECDLAAEHEARTLYTKARQHCETVGDFVSKNLFEELIADEEGHIDFLETQLDLVEKLGEEKYALLNASKMDEAE